MSVTAWLSTLILFTAPAHAEFHVPSLTGPVVDSAQVIEPSDYQWLEEQIRTLNHVGVAQVQVLTLENLGGLPIEQASIQVTDQWKLGDAKKDNGILVLFAKEEHEVRIEVGQGLEGTFPDALAGRIIRNVMIPRFRDGQVSTGIVEGVSHIIDILRGEKRDENSPPPSSQHGESGGEGLNALFVFLFIMIFLMRLLGGMGLRRRSGFWSGGGWGSGGFGGGGFGGGGGWSGGGGGFSGGGSSGKW